MQSNLSYLSGGKSITVTEEHDKFMSEQEIEESSQIISLCNNTVDDTISKLSTITQLDEAYNGEQPEDPDRPNSRINYIHPNIEGQVADVCLQKLGFVFKGQEENDEKFADDARIQTEWTMEHQDDELYTRATFFRRLIKYGFAYYKACYDPSAFDGFGLSVIETPSVDRVFIDQKITNPHYLQKAEYIFEYIDMSRDQALAIYGEDKANAISYGNLDKKDTLLFNTDDYQNDSETYWTLIQMWNREKGNLRCREYTATGLLLWDSAKGLDRTVNQKTLEYNFETPVYTKVNNKYPYVMKNCYDVEGELFGHGDVHNTYKIQEVINTLYDNIRVSTRPNRLLIDTRSNILPEDIEDDAFEPLPYDGNMLNGSSPITEVSCGTPTPEWWRMLSDLRENVQKITRFNELMTGQGSAGKTATESAILQQQGSKSTSMKLAIMSNAIKEVAMYCLGLDLQFKSGKKAMRIGAGQPGMRYIDYDALNNIPVSVPMEMGEREEWKKAGYSRSEIPETQIATSNGKPITRSIALDLKVSIGNKMPNSPAMLGQIINQFASLALISEDGTQRPVITWEEFRKLIIEIYDLPLESVERIKEGLKMKEQQMEKERQQQMAMQQAVAQAKQSGQGSESALPNGSPKSLDIQSQRGQMGVMEGNADFMSRQ